MVNLTSILHDKMSCSLVGILNLVHFHVVHCVQYVFIWTDHSYSNQTQQFARLSEINVATFDRNA